MGCSGGEGCRGATGRGEAKRHARATHTPPLHSSFTLTPFSIQAFCPLHLHMPHSPTHNPSLSALRAPNCTTGWRRDCACR